MADIASAYFLGLVLVLLSGTMNLTSERTLDVLVIGGLISSFFVIVDPVTKLLQPVVKLRLGNSYRQTWAERLFDRVAGRVPQLPTQQSFKKIFLRNTAAKAFLSPYLGKERAKLSSGLMFSAAFFGLSWYLVSRTSAIFLTLLLIGLGTLTLLSIYLEAAMRVPEYCWILAIYGVVVQFVAKQFGDPTKVEVSVITKLMTDSNWEEAAQWLEYYLT